LDDLRDELIDRYGPLPPEAANLVTILALKQRLRSLGIIKLEQGPNALVYSFVPVPSFDPSRIVGLLQQKPERKSLSATVRLTPDQRLVVPLPPRDNVFARIQSTLAALAG
jgi:transcription-repair coupling factor (superfamily II helicase)